MKKTNQAKTPKEYIGLLEEPRKSEIQKIHDFIRNTVPDLEPYMQSGFVGYGKYHYKYASGREGEWCRIALASNKAYISVYICATVDDQYIPEKYKKDLPKASIGKSCVRFKRFEDLDFGVLEKMLKEAEEIHVREQLDKK